MVAGLGSERSKLDPASRKLLARLGVLDKPVLPPLPTNISERLTRTAG